MNINEFSNWNEPEYIESCNSIISHGNCKDVKSCIKCPFHWHNLTKEFADCTEYSDTNDCVLQDDKLVQSAKQFLELVEFQKRVESTSTKLVSNSMKTGIGILIFGIFMELSEKGAEVESLG